MPDTKESLSTIRIFEQVKSNIAKIDTPPLSLSNLRINKDELKNVGDEDIETGIPFARFAISFPESNTEFTYSLNFLNTGVALAILDYEPVWRTFSELGETNKQISTLITDVLKCLSNSQLAMLATSTEDDDTFQAFELLYRKPGKQKYDAILTGAVFQSERKLKGREYKTDVYVNNASIPNVSLSIDRAGLLLIHDQEDERLSRIGRKNIVGLHEPLRREVFYENINRYAQEAGEKAEKKVGEAFDRFDIKLGINNMSLSEQITQFSKWRHIELIFWALSLILCHYIVEWKLSDVNPSMYVLAVVAVLIFIFRKKLPYPKTLFVLAPIAYVLFAIGVDIYLSNVSAHWVVWVIGIFALISLAENLYFDIRAIVSKRTK